MTAHLNSVGTGTCKGHIGELFQSQLRIDSDCSNLGELVAPSNPIETIALVTLPAADFKVEVTFIPDTTDTFKTDSNAKTKSLMAAISATKYIFEKYGYKGSGGTLRFKDTFPENSVGWGLGSSSADIIATIRAVASSYDVNLGPDVESAIAFQTEGATDSLAYGQNAVLFLSRLGRKLEDFECKMPKFSIIVVNPDPQKKIDTSAVKFDYPEYNYSTANDQVMRLKEAIRNGDIETIGQVSTWSATFNLKHFNDIPFSRIIAHALKEIGAHGIVTAHTGTVIGGIFKQMQAHQASEFVFMIDELKKILSNQNLPVNDFRFFHIFSGYSDFSQE